MEEYELLDAIASGATLKVHRSLDGDKEYRLHFLSGNIVAVEGYLVERLCNRDLLDSNMKFPAATYLLTARGRQLAADRGSVGAKSGWLPVHTR